MTSDTQDLKALVEQAHEAVACLKEEDAELHRIAFQQVLQHLLTNGAPPAKDQSAAPAREMPPFDRVLRQRSATGWRPLREGSISNWSRYVNSSI